MIDYKDLIRFYMQEGVTAPQPLSAQHCILGQYLNNQGRCGVFRVWPSCPGEGSIEYGFGDSSIQKMADWENNLAIAFDCRYELGDVETSEVLSLIREFIGTEAYDDAVAEIEAEKVEEKELVNAH